MAKEEKEVKEVEVKEVKAEKVKTDREVRWGKHVENYAKANPVKYAAKKAHGEFDTVPVTFR